MSWESSLKITGRIKWRNFIMSWHVIILPSRKGSELALRDHQDNSLHLLSALSIASSSSLFNRNLLFSIHYSTTTKGMILQIFSCTWTSPSLLSTWLKLGLSLLPWDWLVQISSFAKRLYSLTEDCTVGTGPSCQLALSRLRNDPSLSPTNSQRIRD